MAGHTSACVYTLAEETKVAFETEETNAKADGKKYELISSISAISLRFKKNARLNFIAFSTNLDQSPVQDKYTPPPDAA